MANRSVLFYRHFERYSGGHQKVFDYFSHLRASEGYQADICFSQTSQWNITNPWFPDTRSVGFLPEKYNYLFLAGMDWVVCSEDVLNDSKPIINLIQHVRHAEPNEDVHPFLKNKAIRICVSPEVESAIAAIANGPVITIANGIEIPSISAEKCYEVFIAGFKNPSMALALSTDSDVTVETTHVPRNKFLKQLASARIAVVLPHPDEGFFLPALEAMCLADIAIIPDCIGNRSFCIDAEHDGGNCLMPSYNQEEITGAIRRAKNILNDPVRLHQIKTNAMSTVNAHSLSRERQEFLKLISNVDELWHEG